MGTAHKTKIRIKDVRRIELIEAAYRVFLADGLNGLTTTRICREAGMSQGILTYYFKNKDEVLFQMVRHSNRLLVEDIIARLRRARTGWERLLAVIEGNFPERHYDANTANAWVSFFAAAASNGRYAMLQQFFYRRLRSNLASALAGNLAPGELDHFARGFAAMIDGLWLRRGCTGDLTAAEAVRLVTGYSERALGPAVVARLRQTESSSARASE
jgi:TetR/AcrR family transcriptional repressor of bet genes